MKETSRREFGKTLTVWTAAAVPAAAQEKKAETETAAPCIVNPRLGEYGLPRSTEPAFTFKA